MITRTGRHIGFTALIACSVVAAALISATQPHAASWNGGVYKEWLRRVAADPGVRNAMSGTLRPATTASALSHVRFARSIDLYDATR